MKRKKKRQEKKVYRTNVDTISLNVEQFGGRAPFYPGCAFWEKPIDSRRLRKKGSQICR